MGRKLVGLMLCAGTALTTYAGTISARFLQSVVNVSLFELYSLGVLTTIAGVAIAGMTLKLAHDRTHRDGQ